MSRLRATGDSLSITKHSGKMVNTKDHPQSQVDLATWSAVKAGSALESQVALEHIDYQAEPESPPSYHA